MDNDCDGVADDATAIDAQIWYLDADNDGYGVDNVFVTQCEQPLSYTLQGGDCNDSNNLAFPDATEVCDGYDNDCDELVDDNDPDNSGNAIWYLDAMAMATARCLLVQCEQPAGYVQAPNL